MHELNAAAERLRTGTQPSCFLPDGKTLNPEYMAYWRDAGVVTGWALKLLDPTPIDEAWLREMGFEKSHATMYRKGRIEYQLPEGYVTIDDNDYGNEWAGLERRFTTRGAVRALLFALSHPTLEKT